MRGKIVVSALALTATAAVVVAQDGIKSIIGNVFLQNTTPGTAQVGHANITGTFRAGQMFVQQGSAVTIPVVGNSLAVSGTTFGGSFSNAAPNGAGVRGTSTATSSSSPGVLGIARGDSGIGVRGVSENPNGTGVKGESPDSVGVFGISTNGIGVRAISQTDTAVAATSNGPNHSAASAINSASSGTSNFGVFGQSSLGTGVYGLVTATSGITTGVLGETKSAAGFGVFSRGDIGATGTKSFVIDHPLDPQNMYLRHFCAEGPEPRNVYQGSVVTDASGRAWVTLPEYYEAINRDPLVQLTVVDESADFVQVKVSKRLANGRFQVRTSKPHTEVNWRVDAVRADRWVQQHGVEAERAKPTEFRGTFLQPELYGQPESKGQWRSRPLQEHARLP